MKRKGGVFGLIVPIILLFCTCLIFSYLAKKPNKCNHFKCKIGMPITMATTLTLTPKFCACNIILKNWDVDQKF
jgi:hypothetical protein